MNLALHGFLLQVFVSILNLQHGPLLCSAGEPGYLDFDNLPETNFSCQGKVIGGYYADVEAGCQMFHVCTIGQKDEIMDIKFLCLNGTVFDQETRVCERVDEVDCSKSERFYNLNLELYGNNAVTLSLHENSEDDIDPLDVIDDHQHRTTSARPSTTSTTTTTTSKPNKPSTTPASSTFSHPTGYPQHFQPQPPFPQVHTSQSKSLYDDKNGGYHHQYIFHNGERNNNQQATSYQLFSNQGVSSTTVQPPQVHQIRFSSTSSPQIIHNEPSTVSPLFHATSSTIQTLLNSNGNGPALINPIFHSHGIASTTEQFTLHNNNPRETSEYQSGEQSIRPLEAVQSTSKGKVSKLTISPVPTPSEPPRLIQTKTSQSSQQQRITGNFLPTPSTDETTVRSFYPTLRSASKSTQSSQSTSEQVTQHIHVLPPVPIPQLKPHQITINLPPPDIQRIVQNPSPLQPSQSRVIVTAKASVSDESGRPLNTTQLVTLALPTIPASYDDYKEGDESFDPFYRDVPKIRNARRVSVSRTSLRVKRSVGQTKNSMVSFVYGGDRPKRQEVQMVDISDKRKVDVDDEPKDFTAIKESLMRFRDILFGTEFNEDTIRSVFGGSNLQGAEFNKKAGSKVSLEDLEPKASKNFKAREYEDSEYDTENKEDTPDYEEYTEEEASKLNSKESDAEEYVDVTDNKEDESDLKDPKSDEVKSDEEDAISSKEEETKDDSSKETDVDEEKGKRVLDIVILDPNEYLKTKSLNIDDVTEQEPMSTDVPILSTTKETTESILSIDIDSTKKQDPKDAQEHDNNAKTVKYSSKIVKKDRTEEDTKPDSPKSNKQHKKTADQEKERANEENKAQKSKEEPKPNVKRKSSRIRSSSGKISARKKDLKKEERKTQNDEASEPADDKVIEDNIITTTPVIDPEIEQIDEHIFDEPESQTSKELDTRAVGHRIGHGKSLQSGKDQEIAKDDRKDANEYEVLDKHAENLMKEEKHEEIEAQEESTTPSIKDEEEYDAKTDSVEVKENHSMEEKAYYEEETSMESTEDESIADASHEDETEAPKVKSSRRNKSMKFEVSSKEAINHRQDKSRKLSDDEQEEKESQEYSTIKSEEISSQEGSSEYHDSTEAFYDSSHEENDYKDPKDHEDSTISSGDNSKDTASSREETVEENDEEANDQEDSTEGILKFTDELPKEKKEDLSDNKKPSEPIENSAHDYVDDNYEPDNYKEREDSKLSDDKTQKRVKDMKTEDKIANDSEENKEDKVEVTTAIIDTETETTEQNTERPEEELLQTTTSTTTTTTTTSTTTTSTTTTAKPTPPKLFKPVSARKSYAYIPPTTTPNPVVIKPRLSLLNPKPAKPPKSYNELAPKPVIRKFTLLSRKSVTTVPTTTIKDDDSTEVPMTIAEIPVTVTEAVFSTTEASRSEENVLEVKLDKDQENSQSNDQEKHQDKVQDKDQATSPNESSEPMQKDQPPIKNNGDQDSSPSEQKSPVNVKKEDKEYATTIAESFTPYPVTRLSTLASTIQETLKEIESTTEIPTTPKNYTFVEVEILSTTVPPVATIPSEPDHIETTTMKILDETSTESTTPQQDSTVLPLAAETSTQSTTTEAVKTTFKEPDEVVAATIRSSSRKATQLRKEDGFNCLEKEMYRFYGDTRDCRLFHYCSPGFTSRQVLDFRFVCEEGTAFDEESQSCRHDVRNRTCPNRKW